LCKAISDSHVRELGRAGVRDAEDLIEVLGLDQPDCCGHCARQIDCFVDVASIETGNGPLPYQRQMAAALNATSMGASAAV
jgi:bacterioferritin-associated ferredoxin